MIVDDCGHRPPGAQAEGSNPPGQRARARQCHQTVIDGIAATLVAINLAVIKARSSQISEIAIGAQRAAAAARGQAAPRAADGSGAAQSGRAQRPAAAPRAAQSGAAQGAREGGPGVQGAKKARRAWLGGGVLNKIDWRARVWGVRQAYEQFCSGTARLAVGASRQGPPEARGIVRGDTGDAGGSADR
ncbi:MAG: hypothetical protein J3K34DRAFT_241627 [Monoraphidium minutum]|nr:MAG: hypothetical protein J3K34DRAFT_241627 [Monoraphidium minutum]